MTNDRNERFKPLVLEALHEFQRPLGEQIMKVSSIGLDGPYRLLLRSPVLGQRVYDLLYYLRGPRVYELDVATKKDRLIGEIPMPRIGGRMSSSS